MNTDPNITPQFEDVSDTFFGLTKAKAAGIFGILAVISVNVLAFFLIQHVNRNATRLTQNRRALAYTCSTTRVLAGLVGFVVDQNQAALKNKQLHLSREQVTAIRVTIARFARAKALLNENGACREISEP